ncbi:cytochrome c oxidase assembly protein [Actinoplanes lobatus]|uniref:Cytochrome c oxidase assembly protein n=1 Tax=Actinoplanes lobatus TaxID=113568 RepID=A0A7W7HHX8_9ACTN|nr:cytochrome d ubiquinol oxidase subunit II [Actinoplanes lobatus]MBB4750866.1 cytochrome d ubiquinol oxidase subunit II [Actinoplanes lobatus]GGN92279.1 cytochrome c oxidase assembly protein [Actinoplanes lobatus]GIE44419.1 cytochrome c oxidase assembly protein [Actinoplanes lobatus]
MITFWFAVLVLTWVLYFVLEGFDFGVGVLSPVLGREEHERGAIIRTVGPFWDGNEVWLVAAVGVTFAAFPAWYAALMSALYLPMVAILLLLAVRGVALEFRGKHDSPSWRRRCDLLLAASSGGIVLLWGAVLGVLVDGLALGSDGEVTGTGLSRSLGPLLSPAAGLGALAALLAAVLLGATFLALRTTGPVRRRARDVARHTGTAGAVTLLLIGIGTGNRLALAAAAVVFIAGLQARRSREGTAFTAVALAVAGAVAAVFTAHGSVVLRSTLDPAWSLTRASAAAGPEALRLITIAGVLILPGVLVYQAWSYWVFRRRVASERVAS